MLIDSMKLSYMYEHCAHVGYQLGQHKHNVQYYEMIPGDCGYRYGWTDKLKLLHTADKDATTSNFAVDKMSDRDGSTKISIPVIKMLHLRASLWSRITLRYASTLT